MWLLKSFMEKKKPSAASKSKSSWKTRASPASQPAQRFAPGHLTIIDLSDPFIDSTSACGIFEILVRLFIRTSVDSGKVIVVDEAHKVCSWGSGQLG
jgi:hypothetical protein